jgi:hypothetical protein
LGIVLMHDSERAARENVDLLKKRIATAESSGGTRWTDRVSSLEATVEGNLLIGKLHGYLGFTDFLNRADPLLFHE